MTALEQTLKDAWMAGYKTYEQQEREDTFEIPVDYFFEKYMESVVASLEKQTNAD
jgi:hypothetical protein